MEKLLVKLFSLLKPFFRKSDPDFEKMMIILETKISMDNRRVNMSWKSGAQKNRSGQLTKVLIIYTVFGFMMGLIIFYTNQLLTVMVILHSYILFMMAMTLVTDFSSVLLDTTDNQIILSRPVSSKTFFLARTFHILIYLLQFTTAIALGSWIFMFIKYGILTGIALIITTMLTVLLAVFITYFLYLAMLRFSNEQKMREIITWFQIILTVLFSISYQVFPRILQFSDLREAIHLAWYTYLLPPVWMAVSLEAVQQFNFDLLHLLMILISIVIPIAGFSVLTKYLAPGFSKRLMFLQQAAAPLNPTIENTIVKQSTVEKLAGYFSVSAKEKASFIITWLITGRDRNFRMQFYPALGYILVLFFVFMFRSNQSIAENWQSLPGSSKYLWLIYAPVFLTSTAFSLISFNEHFQASWIFHSTPVDKPGEILIGALKAIIIKFLIPVYILLMIFSLWIWGGRVAFDFLFGFFNNLFCFAVIVLFADYYLPFSRQPAPKQQAGRFAKSILQLLIILVLVAYHFFLLSYPWILTAIIPVLILGIYMISRTVKKIGWNKISI